MDRSLYKLSIIFFCFLLLSACGGGSNDPIKDPIETGIFLDSPVANLSYITPSQSGKTNTDGEFKYQAGETITFSIGGFSFPSTIAGSVITPMDLVATVDINDPIVVKLARLLQSLDIDGNPENGIEISAEAHQALSDMSLDLGSDGFYADLESVLPNAGTENETLVSESEAIAHLQNSVAVKNDDEAPIISLVGSGTVTINQHSKYVDQGASASDNVDGTVTVLTSGGVNTSTPGNYEITYSATDKAGNTAIEVRLVKVVEDDGNSNVTAIVDAGESKVVTSGDTVTLELTVYEGFDDELFTISWSQIEGTIVTLENPGHVTPHFTAPENISDEEELSFEVTVTGETGNVAKDRVRITVQPGLVVENVAPTANAGEGGSVLSGAEITLDGSASTDEDGEITSYKWQQLESNAPYVNLTGHQTSSSKLTLPEVAVDTVFSFQLTATDNKGAVSTDSVSYSVEATPGILISPVSGHTGYKGSVAYFSMRLKTKPSDDLTLSVFSYDAEEGVVENGGRAFTIDNWDQWQQISVRGMNESAVNGSQNYNIEISGFSSSDERYSELEPIFLTMKGLSVEIIPPENDLLFIQDYDNRYQLEYAYSGNETLSFSLESVNEFSPQINESTGEITWNAEGESEPRNITVNVTDGVTSDSKKIRVVIAQPEQVVSSFDEDSLTVTVTDADSSLLGLKVRSDVNSHFLRYLSLYKIPESAIPALPSGIVRTSDVFQSRRSPAGNVSVEIPVDLSRVENEASLLRLFSYDEELHTEGKRWSPTYLNVEYVGDESDPAIRFDIPELKGTYFIGYLDGSTELTSFSDLSVLQSSSAFLLRSKRAGSVGVICEDDGNFWEWAVKDVLIFYPKICTYRSVNGDMDLSVRFSGIVWNHAGAKYWGGASLEDITWWFVQARIAATDETGLNIGEIKEISVELDPSRHAAAEVTPGSDFKRMEVGSSNYYIDSYTKEFKSTTVGTMKAIIAHEFMHLAQRDAAGAEEWALNDFVNKAAWILESSAVWFEDIVFDNQDLFTRTEYEKRMKQFKWPDKFPESGLTSSSPHGKYQRFGLFKLFDDRCNSAEGVTFKKYYRSMLNDQESLLSGAPSEQIIFKALDEMDCDFGSHFGDTKKSSYEAAISYYLYATPLLSG